MIETRSDMTGKLKSTRPKRPGKDRSKPRKTRPLSSWDEGQSSGGGKQPDLPSIFVNASDDSRGGARSFFGRPVKTKGADLTSLQDRLKKYKKYEAKPSRLHSVESASLESRPDTQHDESDESDESESTWYYMQKQGTDLYSSALSFPSEQEKRDFLHEAKSTDSVEESTSLTHSAQELSTVATTATDPKSSDDETGQHAPCEMDDEAFAVFSNL